MANEINLDHITTHDEFNLQRLCEMNDDTADELVDSPFELGSNTCGYFEPSDIKNIASGNLTLFCLNVQGLRAHWDNFYNLLSEMNGDSQHIGIIGITELFSMNAGECDLPGYHPLEFVTRNDSNTSKGGVAMYISNQYQYKHRTDLSVFIPNVFESLFVELKIGKKNIIIGTIYRPNTYPLANLDIFLQNMSDLQNILSSENKDVYIMGDMNIDLLKFHDHIKTGDYLENIFSAGFIPLITKPTRITEHSATLIDHIYTNKQDFIATSGIVITDVSDHFGIFSSITCKHHKHKIFTKSTKTYRSFSQPNIENFKKILLEVDFSNVLNTQCVNDSYNLFLEKYLGAYNQAFSPSNINKYL